jgi:methionine biosynthesis protein MetW
MMNLNPINDPDYNDNRDYQYSEFHVEDRSEYLIIESLVKPNSKVIDLACGSGSLLKMLIDNKRVTGFGIDIAPSAIIVCKNKGLEAQLGEIDKPLNFPDDSFDYSICNVTIQMVMYPEVLLKEMKRISKYQIISFPNFAYFRNRLDLLFNGRMPQKMLFKYKWYNTGHIHQLSLNDFYELVDSVGGLKVLERKYIKSKNQIKNFFIESFPNLFAQLPTFLLTKTYDK